MIESSGSAAHVPQWALRKYQFPQVLSVEQGHRSSQRMLAFDLVSAKGGAGGGWLTETFVSLLLLQLVLHIKVLSSVIGWLFVVSPPSVFLCICFEILWDMLWQSPRLTCGVCFCKPQWWQHDAVILIKLMTAWRVSCLPLNLDKVKTSNCVDSQSSAFEQLRAQTRETKKKEKKRQTSAALSHSFQSFKCLPCHSRPIY